MGEDGISLKGWRATKMPPEKPKKREHCDPSREDHGN